MEGRADGWVNGWQLGGLFGWSTSVVGVQKRSTFPLGHFVTDPSRK